MIRKNASTNAMACDEASIHGTHTSCIVTVIGTDSHLRKCHCHTTGMGIDLTSEIK